MPTLPKPALAHNNLNWVVVYNGEIRASFFHADEAALYATEADKRGKRPAIGHTVFGWCDLAPLQLGADVVAAWLDAWQDDFMRDGWHADRYGEAVRTGALA